MDKWVSFYCPYFLDHKEAEGFVNRCESLTPSDPKHNAKIMMHQTQRLITLAEDIVQVSRRESLQLLFLMICAENISKIHDNFTGEGKSKEYVRKFFTIYLSEPDKKKIQKSFIDNNSKTLASFDFEKIIEILYDVRCDVVHEGKLWDFHFCRDDHTPVGNTDPDVIVYLTLTEFKDIIVRGCITAIEDKLK